MHRLLLVCALAAGLAGSAEAQGSNVLRAAGAFAVQVAWDDDLDAHRLGIDTAVMRTKTELVLRQSGLPVLAVAPGDTLPDAIFRVYASALQLETDDAEPEKLQTFAYLIEADFAEWLPVRGDAQFAETWGCSRFGVAKEAEFLYVVLTQCVEEFANAWLEANPR